MNVKRIRYYLSVQKDSLLFKNSDSIRNSSVLDLLTEIYSDNFKFYYERDIELFIGYYNYVTTL